LDRGGWRAATGTHFLGPLQLAGASNTTSSLSFPAGSSQLHFANSAAQPWAGGAMLYITNWHGLATGGGDTQFYFGSGANQLTTQQLAQIRFFALIAVLSFFGWAGLARLIRGQVLSLREREFIAAARVLGVPTRQVLFKELLPNLVAPIVVSVSLALPTYVVAEAGLTFLGVGLIEPTPSWGVTIAAAQNYYRADPLYLWVPVLGITILVLALSLLGDAVRDAFDTRTRR